jgi:hypothetical protein
MGFKKFRVFFYAIFWTLVAIVWTSTLSILGFVYLVIPELPMLSNAVSDFVFSSLDNWDDAQKWYLADQNEFGWAVIGILIIVVAHLFIGRALYKFWLKRNIEKETCESCGVAYMLSTEKVDTVTTAVPRTKKDLYTGGNGEDRTYITTWTEEIGYSIITVCCESCGNQNKYKQNFNRAVNSHRSRA